MAMHVRAGSQLASARERLGFPRSTGTAWRPDGLSPASLTPVHIIKCQISYEPHGALISYMTHGICIFMHDGPNNLQSATYNVHLKYMSYMPCAVQTTCPGTLCGRS